MKPDGDSSFTDRPMQLPVHQLMTSTPYTVPPNATVRDVALLMDTHRISCVPVVDEDKLIGLVRESDLAALWLDNTKTGSATVAVVMSTQLFTVRPDDTLFDVLALMTRHRLVHIPVTVGERLVGVVTQTDLIRRQTGSSVFMVADISRLESHDAIGEVVAQVPRLLQSLADNGSNAQETGRVISSVSGAVTRRLIELAQHELGPAPVDFAWMACGSQGRQEQTTVTDQDNFLVLDDRFDAQQHGQWFDKFSRIVCRGLDAAGYAYCSGDMMAMNPQWCKSVGQWNECIAQWAAAPDREARMMLCVMLDARAIGGLRTLYAPLRKALLESVNAHGVLVNRLVDDALAHPPALGLFKQFALEKTGTYREHLDLKHGAIRPIVELARLHAVVSRDISVNTSVRLQLSQGSRILTHSGARDLYVAHEYVSLVRMRHQVDRIRRKQAPDNYLALDTLPALERDHLRNSLSVIKTIQTSLSRRMQVSGI